MTDASGGQHFIGALGLELWTEDGFTHGRTEVSPEMWVPRTTWPRLGVFATMVDMVSGMQPGGAINPTVDLRISLLAPPPSDGPVELVCRPVKVGRRLFVGETWLRTGASDPPFARSTVTFMNQLLPQSDGFGPRSVPVGPASFDELLGLRFPTSRTVEMDARPEVSNGPGGTVQGGAQALLGEIAAERALADRGHHVAVDLEIRYLNRVRSESVVATAEVLPGAFDSVAVRVPITEMSDDPRNVALVSLVCRPLPGD